MTRPLYTEARTRLDLAVAALAAAVGVGLPLVLAGERLPTVAPAVQAGIGGGVVFGFAVAFLRAKIALPVFIVGLFVGVLIWTRLDGIWPAAIPWFSVSIASSIAEAHVRYLWDRARSE